MPLVLTAGRKPGPGAALIPELARAADTPAPIERSAVDAFDDPAFKAAVEATGRRALVFGGVALDVGVAAAALSARSLGHEACVVAEACATTDPLAEATALSRLAAAGAHWIGFAALALGLMGDFAGPRAPATQALVQRLAPAHAGARP